MPDANDTVIAEAERQVRESEERLARQLVLVRKLKIAGRHGEADAARDLLAALTDTLRTAPAPTDGTRDQWALNQPITHQLLVERSLRLC